MSRFNSYACALAAGLSLWTVRAEVCVKSGDKVAFMGDSITQFGNNQAGYVNLVMRGLEIAGVKAEKIAAGVSGHKSVQMHGRLDRDVLAHRPQWMTFSCGVNDVWHGKNGVPLEKYREFVSDIFDRCAASNVNVIVLTPTLIGEDPANDNNRKLDAYVAWLREEAARRNLRLADLNARMKAELAELTKTDASRGNKLTRDGVHMAFRGDCMMAWGVLEAMGVDPSKKDEIYAAFRRISGAYRRDVLFTAEQWESIASKLPPGAHRSGEIFGAWTAEALAHMPAATEPRSFAAPGGTTFNYRWHEPQERDGKYPLVVFLHGAGERGDDNASQMVHGVPDIFRRMLECRQPFFLIAGQCPHGCQWVDVPWGSTETHAFPEKPSVTMAALEALVARTLEDPRVDRSRVYVTGVSMGGYGTWDLAMRHPEWFAAAMPICGGAAEGELARLKAMKLFVFHGGADKTVPTVRSRRAVEALKALGADVQYTEYPGEGHNSWSRTYSNASVLDAFFSCRKQAQE